MTTRTRPPVRWRSIERELPLLISALVLATVAAFAWTAYVRTRRIVINGASARITESAKTVASLLVQAAAQDYERSRQVGADTAIQRYLTSGTTHRRGATDWVRHWQSRAHRGSCGWRSPDPRSSRPCSGC
jgi:hypothetical protein